MKTATEIKFDTIVKEGFYHLLKPMGFKKKANNFYLQLDGLVQIINLQKSQWGTKDDISFTINTGLFLPEYWAGLNYNQGKEIPIFPTEPQCLIRKRIGSLKNKGDEWYEVNKNTDEQKLVEEMQTNVSVYILPYFNKIKTKEALLHLLDSENEIDWWNPLGKLITYGELKQFDKARKAYFILKEKMEPSFLEEYRRKYGID